MTSKKKQRLILGAHISIAGGIEKSFERAESIGCTCMQIFTKSNRQWHAKPITDDDAQLFIQKEKTSFVRPVVVHCSYLVNLGAEKPEMEKKSIDALEVELQRCQLLKIPYLVVHPGSRGSQSIETCLQKIATNLSAVLKRNPGNTMICLENMAGQGSSVGYSFEQLATIRALSTQKDRVGFCFDTCHAFAAGYDLRTPEAYKAVWKEFDATIGLKHLKVMHLNDSKKELASRVDRHEDIGKGKLGNQAFKLIMNDPQLFAIPKILETPEECIQDYARNIQALKDLMSPETKKIFGIH